jgi:hypothetical protein
MKLILALLLAIPTLVHADVAQPPAGTWSVGTGGFDSGLLVANPNVRYVVSDKTMLELTPSISLSHARQASLSSNGQSYGLTLDVLRKIGTYKDTNLSWLVQPAIAAGYTRSDSGAIVSKGPSLGFGLGAGFEVEHFFQSNFSVSARTLLNYTYARQDSYSTGSSMPGSSKSFDLGGQALAFHYYFTNDTAKIDAAPEGRGRWALGWQGFGFSLGNAVGNGFIQPSIKRVLNDRWALEFAPGYRVSHNNTGTSSFHNESLFLPLDFVRTLARAHDAQLSWIIEPSVGYTNNSTALPPTFSNRSKTYIASLGSGLEIEYFLLPELSVGSRAMLIYQNAHASNYQLTGYAGQSVSNSLFINNQVLSVRWYFGG